MLSGILPHWRRKAAERSSKFSSSYEIPVFANAAYYPNWRIYKKQPPSSLRLGFVSHVFYAFAWYDYVTPKYIEHRKKQQLTFVERVKDDGTVYVCCLCPVPPCLQPRGSLAS